MFGGEWSMCIIARKLLAEKLTDDFYDEHGLIEKSANKENFIIQLKAVLLVEQHDLLYRWEAVYAERCGEELRQLVDFVAGILMMAHDHERYGAVQSVYIDRDK